MKQDFVKYKEAHKDTDRGRDTIKEVKEMCKRASEGGTNEKAASKK